MCDMNKQVDDEWGLEPGTVFLMSRLNKRIIRLCPLTDMVLGGRGATIGGGASSSSSSSGLLSGDCSEPFFAGGASLSESQKTDRLFSEGIHTYNQSGVLQMY